MKSRRAMNGWRRTLAYDDVGDDGWGYIIMCPTCRVSLVDGGYATLRFARVGAQVRQDEHECRA